MKYKQEYKSGAELFNGSAPVRYVAQFIIHLLVVATFAFSSISYANQQLNTVLKDIAQKERDVKVQEKQLSTLKNQIAEQEKTIASASRILHNSQSSLTNLKKEISHLERSIEELEKQQVAQQKQLSKQLLAAFKLGKHSGLQLILINEEKQRNERVLNYFNYLNESRQAVIDELQQTQIELALQRNQLEEKQFQQQSLLNQQKSEQQKLQQAQSQRSKTYGELNSSLKQEQVKLKELKSNEAKLRRKIAQAEKESKERAEREAKEAAALLKRQNEAKQKGSSYKLSDKERDLLARAGGLGSPGGRFEWPVPSRQILHRYGEHQQGELRWKAMIIAAPENTQVRSIADGIVVMAGWLSGYGYVVAIDHGKNDMSLYGYNQTVLVNLNQAVKAGQPIGLVGFNLEQGKSALYFEIRRKGQTVNPQGWLKK